jgi:hypothetical protein
MIKEKNLDCLLTTSHVYVAIFHCLQHSIKKSFQSFIQLYIYYGRSTDSIPNSKVCDDQFWILANYWQSTSTCICTWCLKFGWLLTIYLVSVTGSEVWMLLPISVWFMVLSEVWLTTDDLSGLWYWVWRSIWFTLLGLKFGLLLTIYLFHVTGYEVW